MSKIVAIVNQKGGVGKTTTCVSLTAALREKGKRVLLCDFDPQANATSGMGVDKSLSQGIYDVLLNGVEPKKRVVSTRYGDVLPSSKGLAGAGVELVGIQDREHLLRRMYTIRAVRRSLNPSLELEGVLLTMYDSRTNLALQVSEEVKRFFPGKVYSTVIPRNVRLSEAPSHGKPICAYDRASRGCEAYAALAEEFLKKNKS